MEKQRMVRVAVAYSYDFGQVYFDLITDALVPHAPYSSDPSTVRF